MLQHKPAKQQQVKSAHAQGRVDKRNPPHLHLQGPPIQSGLSHATVQRALANPRALAPDDILQLQRTIGNQAVQRMLQQESQAGFEADSGEADSGFEHQLSGTKGSGSPLPQKTKNEFEQSFGTNFDNVRIHTNTASNQLNRSIQAKAFTHSNDIHFSAGEYDPASPQGKQLLAHELTHTIQQTGGKPSQAVQTKLQVGPANDRYEREADQVATAAVSHKAGALPTPQPTTTPRVQRKLHFERKNLVGTLSNKAKLKGMVGQESTFSKLQRLLTLYWTIDRNDLQQQLVVLQGMQKLSAKWLQKHAKAAKQPKAQKQAQYMSVAMLYAEASRESSKVKDKVASREFFTKFERSPHTVTTRFNKVHMAVGQQLDYNERHNLPTTESAGAMTVSDGKGGQTQAMRPDAEDSQRHYEQFAALKKHKLTEAERTIIGTYTDDDFTLMNPAMANDPKWMKSQMEGRTRWQKYLEDPSLLQESMTANQELGKMLMSALNKLPNWEQRATIYRRETLTAAEAQTMRPGFVKQFNHFVSTSKNDSVTSSHTDAYKKNERWSITYHIAASKTGKDIQAYSTKFMEAEVLFAPGTSFQVTQVLDFDVAKKHLEVKVVQV